MKKTYFIALSPDALICSAAGSSCVVYCRVWEYIRLQGENPMKAKLQSLTWMNVSFYVLCSAKGRPRMALEQVSWEKQCILSCGSLLWNLFLLTKMISVLMQNKSLQQHRCWKKADVKLVPIGSTGDPCGIFSLVLHLYNWCAWF